MSGDHLGLGIDAGGTYTDAVVWDFDQQKVIDKAKSLTTPHDLVQGIRDALNKLPRQSLGKVRLTALSTTLATNALVEGRGSRVGLLVLSPWDWTEEQVGHSPLINVPGAVSISGEIIQPLDETACRDAALRLIEYFGCEAIAIAGYASVRNPTLESRARAIIEAFCDVPVVCAHEVSRRLNAIHGAQTAVANARLLPTIRALIDSVKRALAEYGISGQLMVVKGDGSLVDATFASKRPVETVLSGPAASVNGAKVLTRQRNAVVVDIGGTTTDCAVLNSGQVTISNEGARIGNWTIGVDAVDISTVGLGGDSRIDFSASRRLVIGPQRSVPVAYLASEYSSVEDFIKRFDPLPYSQWSDASPLDILILDGSVSDELSRLEKDLVNLLKNEPIPAVVAAERLGLASYRLLPVDRLENIGVIRRASLTPTDILHATGVFTRWNVETAEAMLDAFAVLYGKSRDSVISEILEGITRRLFEEIIRREISYETNGRIRDIPADWHFLINKAFHNGNSGLQVKFRLRRPVIAIGAPAGVLAPAVSSHLHCRVLIPEHADVANAVGAIASQIRVRVEVLIRSNGEWGYTLHGEEERVEFPDLKSATTAACRIVRQRALKRAVEAGAREPDVVVTHQDGIGEASDGAQVFLERRVSAVATGQTLLTGVSQRQ